MQYFVVLSKWKILILVVNMLKWILTHLLLAFNFPPFLSTRILSQVVVWDQERCYITASKLWLFYCM